MKGENNKIENYNKWVLNFNRLHPLKRFFPLQQLVQSLKTVVREYQSRQANRIVYNKK